MPSVLSAHDGVHRAEEVLPLDERLAVSHSTRARRAGSLECFLTPSAVRGLQLGLEGHLDCLLVALAPPTTVRVLRIEEVRTLLRRFDGGPL